MKSQVAVLATRPETVVEDYGRLMRLVKYDQVLPRDQDLILKLNLSWTKYFPACSSQPWQVDGVLKTLIDDGYDRARLFPVENKTVVTNPIKGCRNNKWEPVLRRHGVPFIPLPDVEWMVYRVHSRRCSSSTGSSPRASRSRRCTWGRTSLHLPTVKTHGHSTTTGAIKNAFGGLLKEVRHYAHEFIHEVLVDLMYMQRELHPGVFAVMDGTVMGDGAGPRTMVPRVGNLILASRRSGRHRRHRREDHGLRSARHPVSRACATSAVSAWPTRARSRSWATRTRPSSTWGSRRHAAS